MGVNKEYDNSQLKLRRSSSLIYPATEEYLCVSLTKLQTTICLTRMMLQIQNSLLCSKLLVLHDDRLSICWLYSISGMLQEGIDIVTMLTGTILQQKNDLSLQGK